MFVNSGKEAFSLRDSFSVLNYRCVRSKELFYLYGKKGISLRIYLDNCCYNRPYDDQTYIRIYLDTEAKLHIQGMIKSGELELVTSFMLEYENSKNRFSHKRNAIADFMEANESYYVGIERKTEAKTLAEEIMEHGIKSADALHVACAVLAKCDFFITTDDRLLKYQPKEVQIVTPGEFIRKWEAANNE